MKCDIKNRQLLIDKYINGNLSQEEREAFEEHYFNCDECFQELRIKEIAVNMIKEEGPTLFSEYLQKQKRSIRLPRILNLARPRKKLIWAYAAFISVLFLIGTYYLLPTFQSDNDAAVNFDNNVPYVYGKSGLRCPSACPDKDPPFLYFSNQFSMGISNYMICDYQGAIDVFKELEDVAPTLAANSKNDNFIRIMRDLYFYKGLSHLALSVSKKNQTDPTIKSRHIADAIRYIRQADSLATVNGLSHNDRETYFLGLAFWLSGKPDSALQRLHKIKPDSDFFKDSQELIKNCSNQ